MSADAGEHRAARADVDRTHVQTAEQRMQCSAALPDLVREDPGAAVVEQDEVEVLRAVAGVTPVHSDVYGLIGSPVDDLGSNCRKTSRSVTKGTGVIPISVGQRPLDPGT